MNDQDYLSASDGTGEAVLATIQANRSIGSDTLIVDHIDHWPDKFICTTGTVDSNGFIDPTSMSQFIGHLNEGQVIIESFEPGYSDEGNTTGQVAIIKQTTSWANRMATALRDALPAGVINQFAGSAAPTGWLLCDGSAVSRDTYADLFGVVGTTFGVGNGSTTFNVPDFRSKTAVGAGSGSFAITPTAVDESTDNITYSATDFLKLQTGMSVAFTTTGTLPSPLVAATTYYVIRNSSPSNTIKLATTRADAVAGNAINITTNGTGTITTTHTYTSHTLGDVFGEDAHSMTISEMPGHTHDHSRGWYSFVGSGGSYSVPGGGSALQYTDALTNGTRSTTTGGSTQMNITQPSIAVNYIIKI